MTVEQISGDPSTSGDKKSKAGRRKLRKLGAQNRKQPESQQSAAAIEQVNDVEAEADSDLLPELPGAAADHSKSEASPLLDDGPLESPAPRPPVRPDSRATGGSPEPFDTYDIPAPRRPLPVSAETLAQALASEEVEEELPRKTYSLPTPASAPPIQEFDTPPTSSVAAAAAAALAAEERSREDSHEQVGSRIETGPARSPAAKVSSGEADEDDGEYEEFTPAKRRLRWLWTRPVSFVVICAGTISTGVILWWIFGRGQTPSLADFSSRSLESSYGDDLGEPLTLAELSSRSRILGIQVNRINRALFREEQPDADVGAEEIQIPPRIPLVAYSPRQLSDEDQKRVDDLLNRYGRMVKEKGPDGRQLDPESVAMFSGYLQQVVETVDAKGPHRADAVHELSELCKLIYLLQLSNIRSTDSTARAKGLSTLLEATNSGLSKLYVEFSIGDLKFEDIFFRAEPAEQARLMTVRYWYHRAVNPETARTWVEEMISLVDASERQLVRDSIAEVDAIE